jgi:hypothetical protein
LKRSIVGFLVDGSCRFGNHEQPHSAEEIAQKETWMAVRRME